MKFNSQICTTREQSERLIALGLKKETADMYRPPSWGGDKIIGYYAPDVVIFNNHFAENINDLPAWSLGRLIKDLMPQSIGHLELAVGSDYAGYYEEMYYSEFGIHWEYVEETSNMFDNIISTIEWLIKEGHFPKEYLI